MERAPRTEPVGPAKNKLDDMKYPMLILVAALVGGCSHEQAGTGPSLPTEPSSVVVAPHTRPPAYPPPEVSPQRIGRLNPDVTQATIAKTVCVPGWTAKIRPPTGFTSKLKRMQLPAGADPAAYEEDHLIPLGLGGAPWDPKNLRPIPWKRARLDDVWETRLHRKLCAGEVTLVEAQREISAVKRKP